MTQASDLNEEKDKCVGAQSLSWLHFLLQTNIPALTSQPRTSQGQDGTVSFTAKILSPFSVPTPILSLPSGCLLLGYFASSSTHHPQIHLQLAASSEAPSIWKINGAPLNTFPIGVFTIISGSGGEPAPEHSLLLQSGSVVHRTSSAIVQGLKGNAAEVSSESNGMMSAAGELLSPRKKTSAER